ncbi:MAG: glyoxalase/bleomycin resistance/extradiol dioxygenase family protein [Chloroflexi bacterium]|nr:glyoxalase/bleomycin resistance/extradiol dioxygenase family protein [Chloroflexota bacterium]MYF22421.1 glyoxalase/bleomycin resistance/extradiol dioxygenase family protein [Chloroflexota bacterium]
MADAADLGHQRIVPALTYADAPAAIEWLCRVFGFEEVRRMEVGDGRIGNAALRLLGEEIMLASPFEEAGTLSPRDLAALHQQITVYVDDVDAHYLRARDEGARVLAEPADQFWGGRTYWVEDLEGHRWTFQQQLRSVPDEESAAEMLKIASNED